MSVESTENPFDYEASQVEVALDVKGCISFSPVAASLRGNYLDLRTCSLNFHQSRHDNGACSGFFLLMQDTPSSVLPAFTV